MEIRLPACRCGKLGEDAKVPLILLLRIPLAASLIIFVPPMRKMSHKTASYSGFQTDLANTRETWKLVPKLLYFATRALDTAAVILCVPLHLCPLIASMISTPK